MLLTAKIIAVTATDIVILPLPIKMYQEYSETCSCDVTTCIQRPPSSIQGPLGRVPIVALYNTFLPLLRDHLYSKTFFLAQAWSLSTGFIVFKILKRS